MMNMNMLQSPSMSHGLHNGNTNIAYKFIW